MTLLALLLVATGILEPVPVVALIAVYVDLMVVGILITDRRSR